MGVVLAEEDHSEAQIRIARFTIQQQPGRET